MEEKKVNVSLTQLTLVRIKNDRFQVQILPSQIVLKESKKKKKKTSNLKEREKLKILLYQNIKPIEVFHCFYHSNVSEIDELLKVQLFLVKNLEQSLFGGNEKM